MPYDPVMVAPMRREMVEMGAKELTSAAEVEKFLAQKKGTALVFINSVCGCAAGSARPGIRQALAHEVRPDRAASVFAGQDLEATARARGHFADIPPSSPSIALFRNGELVYFVPRHRIEGRDAASVAYNFVTAFDEHCK